MATIEHRGPTWSGVLNDRNVEYLIRGVDNFNDAYNLASEQIPGVFPGTGLIRGTIRLTQRGDMIWYATANYTLFGGQTFAAVLPARDPPEVGTLTRSANFQAKDKRISRFIEPLAVYELESLEEGAASENRISHYDDLKWLIDATNPLFSEAKGRERKFEPLAESRTLTMYVPNIDVTDAYFDIIEDLVTNGSFNAGNWRGRPEGSVQIVRFSANERSADDWEFSFGFGYKATETEFRISDKLILPTVRGCDYYWTDMESVFNSDSKRDEPVATRAVLGRAWHLADFSVLGLPA